MTVSPLILLHPDDNVLVARIDIAAEEDIAIEGASFAAPDAIAVGHKAARRALGVGDKVIKYGAPIGSMTAPAGVGAHIHLHNMKSDYIAAHQRNAVVIEKARK